MAKRESTFANMVIVLFLITFIASATLGGIYELTKAPIELAKKNKKETSIKQVLPEFDNIKSYKIKPEDGADSLEFNEAFLNNELVGTAIETYTDRGFSGRIKIMVGLIPDGTIYNIAVIEHKETPGLGDKMDASKSDFSEQFKGKQPTNENLTVKKDGGNVDAITAATISSRAFCDAVDRASKTYAKKGGKQ